MINKLLDISLQDVQKGYTYYSATEKHVCLICGKEFAAGEVFSFDNRFYEAAKAVQLHMAGEHGDMLEILTGFDKKYTGLTGNQRDLLIMFYKGLSDMEIAKKTGVAPATVRHQRFVFREKAKQAKLYLAIFEIVENAMARKKGKCVTDELIDIHSSAKMVDDRYLITKAEEEKIIASVFISLSPLKLKEFSPKEKKKIVILRKIASQFERGRRYSEKEINLIIKDIFEDFATIRRYLIEYGFMERTKDCNEYWLV